MNATNRDLARFAPRTKPAGTAPKAPRTAAPPAGPNAQRPGPGGPGRQPTPGKANDIFLVIRQLSDLLTRENMALKRHRPQEVQAMTERKEQLARLYQGHMNAIHRDPGILKALDEGKKLALVQSATRLTELMKENASLLKANIQTINTFLKSVVKAVKTRQEEKSAAYSRDGFMNSYGMTRKQLAVSFNQTM